MDVEAMATLKTIGIFGMTINSITNYLTEGNIEYQFETLSFGKFFKIHKNKELDHFSVLTPIYPFLIVCY